MHPDSMRLRISLLSIGTVDVDHFQVRKRASGVRSIQVMKSWQRRKGEQNASWLHLDIAHRSQSILSNRDHSGLLDTVAVMPIDEYYVVRTT